MGSILIVAEIQGGQIRESSFELAAYAQKISAATGREITSLVLGKDVASLADGFAKKGVGKVFLADDELLANYCVESANAAISWPTTAWRAPTRRSEPPSRPRAPT